MACNKAVLIAEDSNSAFSLSVKPTGMGLWVEQAGSSASEAPHLSWWSVSCHLSCPSVLLLVSGWVRKMVGRTAQGFRENIASCYCVHTFPFLSQGSRCLGLAYLKFLRSLNHQAVSGRWGWIKNIPCTWLGSSSYTCVFDVNHPWSLWLWGSEVPSFKRTRKGGLDQISLNVCTYVCIHLFRKLSFLNLNVSRTF